MQSGTLELTATTDTGTNGGTFNIAAGATVDLDGTLSMDTTGKLITQADLTFAGTLTDGGLVDVQSGTLELTATTDTVTSGGAFNIAAGATVDLDGTLTMLAGSHFGAGTGTLSIDTTGKLITQADLTFAGTLTAGGLAAEHQATRKLASRTLTVNRGGTFNIPAGATLYLHGTLTM